MEKARILIVEDESIVAMEIQSNLLQLGYEVCAMISSGEEAISEAGVKKPDLILMDVNLQREMDGIEAASQIRRLFDIPVVYLTAYSDKATTERAKHTQPLGYIQKPFQMNELRVTLEIAIYTARVDVARKLAGKDLLESEKRYRDLFNQMADGFAVYEMIFDDQGAPWDYRFLSVNPAFERQTNLKAADIQGKTVLEVMPNTERYWIDTYGKVVKSGAPIQFDSYVMEIDKHFEVSAYHIRGIQFACSFVDITERKKAEEKLARESKINSMLAEISTSLISSSKTIESFSKMILEHSQEITQSGYGDISVVDPQKGDHRIIATSSGADENIDRESLMKAINAGSEENPSLKSRVADPDCPKSFYKNLAANQLENGSLPRGDISIANYLSVPVFIQERLSGQIVLANNTGDYSENDLKAVEQIGELYALAIQRHRNETEKKIMQEQMLQMQKMEAIGTLAGGIAHDFNNILQPIMGYANMALRNIAESEKNHKYVSSILTASKRAKELVQQILTFARKSNQELQPVEIQLITKEAIKLLRSSLPATIEIKQQISRNSGMVMADPIKIHQIVMNLTTNAFHAMQERGGIMVVKLEAVELNTEDIGKDSLIPGKYIRLTVSDTGVGMNHEVLEKIFDPYYTTKGQSRGTGLGLSVVAGIVASYGGRIKVSSEPGRGSDFDVFLPQIVDEREPPTEKISETAISGHETILLVDDEPVIAELEEGMLRALGYQIIKKISSLEALDVFSSQPDRFDLVITDMTMPSMTGVELARQMLTIQPNLPIILCTGFSELINDEKAKAMGIKKLLMKPISQNQLGIAIREVLDGANG